MDHKSTALVLHTIKYGDNALIVKCYTREFGPCTYMARGVRGKRKRSVIFQPLTILDVTGKSSRSGNMINLIEANIRTPYMTIPFDITKRSVGIFLAELMYKSLLDEQPNEYLFDFITDYLLQLDEKPWTVNHHLGFLAGYARQMGIQPDVSDKNLRYFDLREGSFTDVRPEHPHHLGGPEAMLFAETSTRLPEEQSEISMTPESRKIILSSWVDYFRLHLEGIREIRSHTILETILR